MINGYCHIYACYDYAYRKRGKTNEQVLFSSMPVGKLKIQTKYQSDNGSSQLLPSGTGVVRALQA